MSEELLVYGSYGYTGSLITGTAVSEGLSPTLAGRRAEPLELQATAHELDHRVFSLEHKSIVADQVADADAVLNCAGPFTATAEPLVSACLETGTDYLDITGRIEVLEEIAQRDREAEQAGVTLLPAVGFDDVPTDCLAAYLASRVAEPERLALAVDGLGTFSPGTLKSIVEGLPRPGTVRQDGELRTVPAAWKTRQLDFGRGLTPAVTVPWGTISTAYYSTGIPTMETYATVPEYAAKAMRWMRPIVPLAGARPIQRVLKGLIDVAVSGPTREERNRSVTHIWGEVEGESGDRAVARLRTPDTYDVTARTAVESARRVLAGDVDPGFQTPSTAFGPGFTLTFEGIEREDVSEIEE